MTVQEDTIKELTAATITQWIGRSTHASVDLTRKELAKKAAAIKTRYEPFPEGTRYGFAAVIMLASDYRKRVTTLDAAWTFQVPDIPVTYEPLIDGRTSETNKAKREAGWEVHLEEIEDDVLDFTQKIEKEIRAHLLTQCLKLTYRNRISVAGGRRRLGLLQQSG